MEYRNIEIKLYPADPLYASLYTTGIESATIRAKKAASPSLEFREGILRVKPGPAGASPINVQGQPLF
jgi:hypothetical protein